MPNNTVRAAAAGLPNINAHEPAFALTDAGRMYLLLSAIVDRLDIEGSTATFELTPELADELAAFGADREDMEDDDPSEEDVPSEASEQLDTDCRLEPYKPIEMKPTRHIRRGKPTWRQFLFEIGRRVVVSLEDEDEGEREIVGMVTARTETEDEMKYTIQPEGLPEARIEVEAMYVYPAIARA